jgi:hypothetical protein
LADKVASAERAVAPVAAVTATAVVADLVDWAGLVVRGWMEVT